MNKVLLKYIPHGVDQTKFYKIDPNSDEWQKVEELKQSLFKGDEVDFVVLYNNRNVRRKMPGDVILAYREFWLTLTDEQRKKTRLVMHTQPIDDNGTDLLRLVADVAPEIKVVFSEARIDIPTLNRLYNISDVVINIASNEGFGLGTLEALMVEKMIVVNVTGGLQDQCGFYIEHKNMYRYLHEDIDYNKEWGSNHDGRYKMHGSWVVPVFPSNRALVGSPPTPYIFDDRCRWEDAATALKTVYDIPKPERELRGADGKKFALSQQMSSAAMGEGFIEGIDAVFERWTPREKFTLVKA